MEAEDNTVVSAYEKRISQLQLDKQVMQEKIAKCGRPIRDFDDSFRTAMDFLANPHELWASERMEGRHAVMKLTFADRLAYVRGEGFRTPETTLPFKALGGISGSNSEMARPERFELPTKWFEATYSIQLSYGRVCCCDNRLRFQSRGRALFKCLTSQVIERGHYNRDRRHNTTTKRY